MYKWWDDLFCIFYRFFLQMKPIWKCLLPSSSPSTFQKLNRRQLVTCRPIILMTTATTISRCRPKKGQKYQSYISLLHIVFCDYQYFFWLMYRFLNRRQRSRWWVFVRHQLDHRLFQSKWKTWKRKECCCRALVEASSHLSSNSRLFNGSKSTVARFVGRTTKTR